MTHKLHCFFTYYFYASNQFIFFTILIFYFLLSEFLTSIQTKLFVYHEDKIIVGLLYTLFAYEKTVHIQPGVTLKHAKEGTESSAFWSALGGKQAYTSKKVVNEVVRDPHLFTISFNKGKVFLSCYLLCNIIMQLLHIY